MTRSHGFGPSTCSDLQFGADCHIARPRHYLDIFGPERTLEARKLEHGRPPTPQPKKDNLLTSSYSMLKLLRLYRNRHRFVAMRSLQSQEHSSSLASISPAGHVILQVCSCQEATQLSEVEAHTLYRSVLMLRSPPGVLRPPISTHCSLALESQQPAAEHSLDSPLDFEACSP